MLCTAGEGVTIGSKTWLIEPKSPGEGSPGGLGLSGPSTESKNVLGEGEMNPGVVENGADISEIKPPMSVASMVIDVSASLFHAASEVRSAAGRRSSLSVADGVFG
jgi:hypothetical protein